MAGWNKTNNRGTKVCIVCGKRTWVSKGDGTDLCEECNEEALMENEHNDGHHKIPNPDCPQCK